MDILRKLCIIVGMHNVEIIILAGGKGTRMESDKPKALTMLAGKPFLGHILDTLKNADFVSPPIIVVGYKKDEIYDYVGSTTRCAVQESQLGTGDAVKSAKTKVMNTQAPVLVLYADHPLISIETIHKLIAKQSETKSPIVMATTTVPHFSEWYETFSKWGRFKRNQLGDITEIIEYKDATAEERQIREVNPAYSIFDGVWLWEHLDILKNENSQGEYYLTDLVKYAFNEGYMIPSVSIPPEEAIGANSKNELQVLEEIYKKSKI
jgi:bifunctional UDP-N-acetylglucosamine pyrophosphorylase/glucosamine-1-phosphate N-acetyltransferase